MSSNATPPKRPWLRLILVGVAIVGLAFVAFFAWTAVETYVFAQQIHLLSSTKNLQNGMTQEEVEDIFGVKPEDRKAPKMGGFVGPEFHEGVKRYTQSSDGVTGDTYVNYTGWYQGLIVTSQHHVEVIYDKSGKLKKWLIAPK